MDNEAIFAFETRMTKLEGFLIDEYVSDHYDMDAFQVLQYDSIEDIIEHFVTTKMEVQIINGNARLVRKENV